MEGGRGGGGDISSTLPYILHYHMVLHPKGTSHNDLNQKRPESSETCQRNPTGVEWSDGGRSSEKWGWGREVTKDNS